MTAIHFADFEILREKGDFLKKTIGHLGLNRGSTIYHYFSAQREGLLHDGHHDEVDQTDPYYAHCKLHSDKVKMR